jgi:hypothetical protein
MYLNHSSLFRRCCWRAKRLRGVKMNIRAIMYATAFVVSVAVVQPVMAQQGGVQIGRLRCTVDAGFGLVVASRQNMSCIFTSWPDCLAARARPAKYAHQRRDL